jgi:hypothetical protein
MSDPTRLPEEEQTKPSLHAETEEINRLERLIALHDQAVQPVAEIDEPPVKQERLFSRKTLFGWAFGTIVVVFIIRMVLPAVFESVKSSIASSIKEAAENTAVTPVVAPAPPTSATPALPPKPAKPAAPAATAAPAGKSGATVIQIEVKKR